MIRDNTGGLKVALPQGRTLAEYGQFADIFGLFSNEGSTHSFLASRVSLLRKPEPPKAIPVSSPSDLKAETFRRVSLTGVIESVKLARPGLDLLMKKAAQRMYQEKTLGSSPQ